MTTPDRFDEMAPQLMAAINAMWSAGSYRADEKECRMLAAALRDESRQAHRRGQERMRERAVECLADSAGEYLHEIADLPEVRKTNTAAANALKAEITIIRALPTEDEPA